MLPIEVPPPLEPGHRMLPLPVPQPQKQKEQRPTAPNPSSGYIIAVG